MANRAITELARLSGGGDKRPPVCRSLFGRPNRENLDRTLTVQENLQDNDDAKRFTERWGLDPISGKPVDGSQYECVPVVKESMPSFYSRGYPRRKTKSCIRSMRERSRSPINMAIFDALVNNTGFKTLSMARPSVKRRLPLDDDYSNDGTVVNDENKQTLHYPASVTTVTLTDTRSNGSCSRVTIPPNPMESTSVTVPTPASSVESSPMSDSYPSPLSLKELTHRTPQQQHQTLVKDYFPTQKKQRVKQSCT